MMSIIHLRIICSYTSASPLWRSEFGSIYRGSSRGEGNTHSQNDPTRNEPSFVLGSSGKGSRENDDTSVDDETTSSAKLYRISQVMIGNVHIRDHI
jgi:hypothetical protein